MAGIHDHTNPGVCIPCAIKHLGAAMVHLGEAMGSTDPARLKRRLLEVTFDMNEAESTHLADRYPALAQEIREMRKKVEEAALGAGSNPGVTRDDIEKVIDKLLAERKKEEERGVKCPACSLKTHEVVEVLTRMDSRTMDEALKLEGEHVPFDNPQAQVIVRALLDHEAKEYGVPAPKTVKFRKSDACPDTSCNVVTNPRRPVESTTFYFYRPEGFNLRSTLHEFYHYVASILGPDKIKARLGGGFAGDPDSESEADKFAFAEISRLRLSTDHPSQSVRMDSTVDNGNGTELVVRKQMIPEIFHASDALYAPIVGLTKESAADLNLQYSPAFIQRGFGLAYQYLATPLGQLVLNGVSWGILGAVATFSDVTGYDRLLLYEWAANHAGAIVEVAGPGAMAAISGHARALGSAAARGNAMDAFHQVIKPNSEISAGFRAEFDAIQKVFAPFQSGGGGDSRAGGAQRPGVTTPPTFQ